LRTALTDQLPADPEGWAAYIEDSGTSMAAPHVSGAIAAFLSVRAEFMGLPTEVKERFCTNATSLGRDRNLEGHGLIDLMRVLSSV
jgi:subtilisin family serine protease